MRHAFPVLPLIIPKFSNVKMRSFLFEGVYENANTYFCWETRHFFTQYKKPPDLELCLELCQYYRCLLMLMLHIPTSKFHTVSTLHSWT